MRGSANREIIISGRQGLRLPEQDSIRHESEKKSSIVGFLVCQTLLWSRICGVVANKQDLFPSFFCHGAIFFGSDKWVDGATKDNSIARHAQHVIAVTQKHPKFRTLTVSRFGFEYSAFAKGESLSCQ